MLASFQVVQGGSAAMQAAPVYTTSAAPVQYVTGGSQVYGAPATIYTMPAGGSVTYGAPPMATMTGGSASMAMAGASVTKAAPPQYSFPQGQVQYTQGPSNLHHMGVPLNVGGPGKVHYFAMEVPELDSLLASGRVAEAARELVRLEKAGERVSESTAERVRRLEANYLVSMKVLQPPDIKSWTPEKCGEIEYSYSLASGYMNVVASAESDADILRAIAGIVEFDLWKEYKPKIQTCDALGEHDPLDTLWHVVQTDCDNIVEVSIVDSLSEDLNSFCVCVQAPSGAQGASLGDITLPPPKLKREIDWFNTFCVTPKKGASGFRLTLALRAYMGNAVATTLNWTPKPAKRLAFNTDISARVEGFLGHITNSEALTKRIEASPRTPFYDQLKLRIEAASS